MGWNSWNHYGCNITEDTIRGAIDAMVSSGLQKVGYNYVNVDDCWAYSRDANGKIQPDPKTFPSGMKALADYAHSKGLKFGVYSDAGKLTCAGRPGSLGYEKEDAESYASWGVDYLKYDNCYNQDIAPIDRYPVMRDALNATGRPIFYSLCEWGEANVSTWAAPVGNSWRTTNDIKDIWPWMLGILSMNNQWAKYAGPGGWNDPDMLEVGNGGMTTTEYKSHFSLWALIKAPLIIGCDITNMDQDTLDILTNEEVIAVNQDPLGIQGTLVWSNSTLNQQVWAGKLFDGSYAVILFNLGTNAQHITGYWIDFGVAPSTTCTIRDLWARKDVGDTTTSFTALVPGHGVAMLKITPH